jgi:hypothetical protein
MSFMAGLATSLNLPDDVTKAFNEGKVAVIEGKVYGGLSQTFKIRNKTGSFSKMVTSGDKSQVVMEEINYDQFAKGCEGVLELELTIRDMVDDNKVLGTFSKGSCFMKNEGLQADKKSSGAVDVGLAIGSILAPLGFDMNDLMARIVKLDYTTDVPLDPAIERSPAFKDANSSFFEAKNRVIPVRLKMATELTRSCVDAFARENLIHSKMSYVGLPKKHGDLLSKNLIKAGVTEYKARPDFDPETRLQNILNNADSKGKDYSANAFLLGLCFELKGDLRRAQEYYTKAVKAEEDNKDYIVAYKRLTP